MNPPQVYMCSPSWTLLPPPSPFHPSRSAQCTSPKHPVSCIECWVLNQIFHSPLSLSSRVSLVPLYFLPLKWHHLISEVIDISAKCLCLQQCWFCEIPQMWTWLPLTMKWTVPQNSFEMLLLVSYSDGCHFNASPNELRPETCQLPLINLPASGLPCTIPQE